MNSILEFIQKIVSQDQAVWIMYLVIANIGLGTLAALLKNKFELAYFLNFAKRVTIVFGAYFFVSIAAIGMADFTPMRDVAWAASLAYLATQIADNLKELGLPIPDKISNLLEKK